MFFSKSCCLLANFAVLCWCIWNDQLMRIFQNKSNHLLVIRAEALAFMDALPFRFQSGKSSTTNRSLRWVKPKWSGLKLMLSRPLISNLGQHVLSVLVGMVRDLLLLLRWLRPGHDYVDIKGG